MVERFRLASECSRREHKSDNTCGDVATQAGISSFALIAREIYKGYNSPNAHTKGVPGPARAVAAAPA